MSEASISDAQQLKNETASRKREAAVSTSEPMEASDRFLELLGGAESNLLRCLDLDCFASGGVAAHTRRTPTDLQDAEAGHAHLVALLQVLDDGIDESAEEFRRGLLRHLVLLGEFRCHFRQGNRYHFHRLIISHFKCSLLA